jgi:hypothetical protein
MTFAQLVVQLAWIGHLFGQSLNVALPLFHVHLPPIKSQRELLVLGL